MKFLKDGLQIVNGSVVHVMDGRIAHRYNKETQKWRWIPPTYPKKSNMPKVKTRVEKHLEAF